MIDLVKNPIVNCNFIIGFYWQRSYPPTVSFLPIGTNKILYKTFVTCKGVGGFNFLSTDGAPPTDTILGEGSSVELIECVSDNFLFGFSSLFTIGGGTEIGGGINGLGRFE